VIGMNVLHRVLGLVLCGIVISGMSVSSQPSSLAKRSVAHRGASSYAPEHTAAAYRLAIEQGADYVEQDLAITRDGVLVCLHDESLERTTNVEERFPDRATVDAQGRTRWLVADLTLAEIKTLDAGSWFDPKFSAERVLTWDEAVDLVKGKAGMFPELKTPALYRGRGIDSVALFAAAVRRSRMDAPTPMGQMPGLIVQSFDEEAVRALASAMPAVPRTFLIGGGAQAERWLSSAERVKEVATFATDLGPAKGLLEKEPKIVEWAHAAGLTVTPYTFRSGATDRFPDVMAEMRHFLYTLGVDAVFTDNPDKFPRRR
jgi:glycerophosphoryl diester phosphodiesterase